MVFIVAKNVVNNLVKNDITINISTKNYPVLMKQNLKNL